MREPQLKQIASWQDAELNALDWMRALGFVDARLTKAGADGGLDIRSSKAVAQVKYEAHDVGRPHLQRLVGARGRNTDVQLIFFTGTRYSEQAIAYANEMDIALFNYKLDGRIQAMNPSAEFLMKRLRAGESRSRIFSRDPHALAIWVLVGTIATTAVVGPGSVVPIVLVFSVLFALYVSLRSKP